MFSPKARKAFSRYQTPFYFYDLSILDRTLKAVSAGAAPYGFHVHYAMKANVNDRILKMIKNYGLGADCVSGGEVAKAVESKFPVNKIVFAGVGKSDAEITFALKKNIFCFNCESEQELEVLNGLARKFKRTASVALRINPNVSANTHHYITTGMEENKFGIHPSRLNVVVTKLSKCKNIRLTGIHFHIGSQITDLNVFKNLCTRINEIQLWFEQRNIFLQHINAGGGLGIDYHAPDEHLIPDFESYFALFHRFLELRPGQELHFELGRAIVAQCGSLISRVLYIKEGLEKNFVILDAGMTELIRPALYQAYHKIENISRKGDPSKSYDVVGPICESSDCFGKSVDLPETKRGDLVAIRSAGAYGEVMSSGYNLRKKIKPVYFS